MPIDQSRSATYTSSRVPCSLFKTTWLYKPSSENVTSGGLLVMIWYTSDWLRSTACPVLNMCSTRVDVWTSQFFNAWWCSLTCCLSHLPIWPMYTLQHSTQGMNHIIYLQCMSFVRIVNNLTQHWHACMCRYVH